MSCKIWISYQIVGKKLSKNDFSAGFMKELLQVDKETFELSFTFYISDMPGVSILFRNSITFQNLIVVLGQ